MQGVAHIRFSNRAVIMPARTEYDRELVLEEAEFYAHRHGTVTLELDDRAMSISVVNGRTNRPCAVCGARAMLAFTVNGHSLCRHCARGLNAGGKD